MQLHFVVLWEVRDPQDPGVVSRVVHVFMGALYLLWSMPLGVALHSCIAYMCPVCDLTNFS